MRNALLTCAGFWPFTSWQLKEQIACNCRWDGNNGPEQTDYVAMKNLIEATPTSVKRFVLTTSAGVDRSNQLPFNILNLFGASPMHLSHPDNCSLPLDAFTCQTFLGGCHLMLLVRNRSAEVQKGERGCFAAVRAALDNPAAWPPHRWPLHILRPEYPVAGHCWHTAGRAGLLAG